MSMMSAMSFDAPSVSVERNASLQRAGSFLAEYTSWLWGCGATCVRIDKNVKRMAEAWGFDVDLTVLPKHITVAVSDAGSGESAVFTRKIQRCGVNFDINTSLSGLSWNVVDHRLGVAEAEEIMGRIVGKRYANGWKIVFLTSLANASFCRLFGGDAAAMAVVFMATFAGIFVKHQLLRHKVDLALVFVVCAFISTVICSGAELFGWGCCPAVALTTSVLYLIPGVPYLNAASDLIDRHYLCSLGRLVDALVLTAALSVGMWLGLSVMKMEMLW